MGNETENLERLDATHWEPYGKKARQIIRVIESDAVPPGVPDASLFTDGRVFDILRTEPSSRSCVFGKAMHMSHAERGIVQNGYFRCRGAKCPHCIGFWLLEVLRRTWAHFDYPDVLYRSIVPEAAWRGRALRQVRAEQRYLAVRTDYAGTRELFTRAPHAAAERVDDPLTAVLDALLRAPAAGTRRYSGLPKEERPPSGWRAFELPEGVTPEEANVLCEQALGRTFAWELVERTRGGSYSKRWRVEGLTGDEVARIEEALLPLKQTAEREQTERREERRARRAAVTWMNSLKSAA